MALDKAKILSLLDSLPEEALPGDYLVFVENLIIQAIDAGVDTGLLARATFALGRAYERRR